MRTLFLFALVSLILGISQRSWSQNAPSSDEAIETRTDETHPLQSPEFPKQTSINFLSQPTKTPPSSAAPAELSLPARTTTTAALQPVPPLAIADYESYIKPASRNARVANPPSDMSAPSQSDKAKPTRGSAMRLEPISGVEPLQSSDKPPQVRQLENIEFAPPAPQRDDPFVSRLVKPKTVANPEVSATPPDMAENADPKPEPVAQHKPLPSHATEPKVQELAPVPQPPMPQEDREPAIALAPRETEQSQKGPTLEGQPLLAMSAPIREPRIAQANKPVAPEHYESIPATGAGLSTQPMTNSSFLPANPESYCFRCGVQCPPCGCNPGGPGWRASRPIPWEVFAQGEYVGPARLAHVPVYRLRVDDRLSFVYRLSGQVAGQPYRLNVRDRIQIQSLSAPDVVNREVIIQPDGTVTLPLLGQVRAAGTTVGELGKQLDEQFKGQIKDPRITVTPIVLNSNLDELRASVDRRYGQGGQGSDARVSPDGTVQLPAIGSVPAQGLTLEELEREVKSRYARIVEGLEVTPTLIERAPRFIYVVGEVKVPGRFTMEGPTTLMQAVALAGSWNVGAELEDVVVFRRDENWQLMATKVNIRSSLLFKKPCPSGEIWLRDSDIVLVPKSKILCADDVIELVFTRGIYGVFPMTAQINFSKLSSL